MNPSKPPTSNEIAIAAADNPAIKQISANTCIVPPDVMTVTVSARLTMSSSFLGHQHHGDVLVTVFDGTGRTLEKMRVGHYARHGADVRSLCMTRTASSLTGSAAPGSEWHDYRPAMDSAAAFRISSGAFSASG